METGGFERFRSTQPVDSEAAESHLTMGKTLENTARNRIPYSKSDFRSAGWGKCSIFGIGSTGGGQ